ncbi:MAG: NAD(P)-dependent oxidoreductase [Verrucomicrobiae bacterium]|nr:NAD(P)-dependent oxidoreductase [Verrucomicrobiae bacterium]
MEAETREPVGVIGQGIIGSRVAECLRGAGHKVYVWNRTPKPLPDFLASPGEVAALADIIQIFVGDSEALRSVIAGMRDRLESRHLIVANGTFDPETVAEVYQTVREAGASFLDAPFTGSRLAAEAGALVYYVGGEARVLERARPVLEASARTILPMGRVGEASLIKIATNMISAATVGILSEAYGLVLSAGIDPERLLEALGDNACCSPLVKMKLPGILEGNYEPHFSLKNMFKDAQYALALGKQLDVDQPVLSTTASMMYRSIQKGRGEDDYSVVAAAYQKAAASDPKSPAKP